MKRRYLAWVLGGLAASGIVAFIIWEIKQASDLREQTVYVRNIPYVYFLGHVVERDGKLDLVKNFPLYADDWRDGIWSGRAPHAMEKINFRARRKSTERHGMMLYSYERQWVVIWFHFDNAGQGYNSRTEWKLVTGDLIDFHRQHPYDWSRANGEIGVFSREEIQQLGIQDLIDFQDRMAKAFEESAEFSRRHQEEREAKEKAEKEAAKKLPVEP